MTPSRLACSPCRLLLAALVVCSASACDDDGADEQVLDAATSDASVSSAFDAASVTLDAAPADDASMAAHDAGRAEAAAPRQVCEPPARVRIKTNADVLDCSRITDVTTQIGSPVHTLPETDATYAAMKPVVTDPPSDRWKYLQRTREILCCKGSLQVVMLGDSIIAGTSNSRWDDYLAKATGATIVKVTSMRSSTGPVWYQEEPRVYCSAVRQLPDLVITGGISMLDAEASRSVIRQIHRDSPDTEILQLTPVFGTRDPADAMTWSYEVDATKDAIRAQLAKVAAEEKVGFLDITAEWGRYILESGMPVTAFKQDIVHPNPQGEQIIGRILTQFLNPLLDDIACGVEP